MNSEKFSSIQDNTMATLGGFFQEARERQGLSLDDVASQTRIQQRHLQALEEENYESLPAKVFTKGFVRSYARVLGLDEDEALQLFLTSSNSFYERTQQEHQHVQIKIEAAHRSRFNWNLVLVLFLIIGGALFILLPEEQENLPPAVDTGSPLPPEADHMPHPSPKKTPETVVPLDPVTSVSPPAPDPVPEAVPADPAPALPAEATKPDTPSPPAPPTSSGSDNALGPGGPLVLEIEATQLTWVVVRSDDQDPHEALLQPGQRLTWRAKNQYFLTLGNAAGVAVRLNGEKQGPFGKPGQVVREILLKP